MLKLEFTCDAQHKLDRVGDSQQVPPVEIVSVKLMQGRSMTTEAGPGYVCENK